MIQRAFFIVALVAALASCAKPGSAGSDSANSSSGVANASPSALARRPLLLSPEDMLVVQSNELTSGPSITGSVQPERRADLRAEVSAVVLEVLKENGDPVRRGERLVRLDDTAIRDSLTSAEASARAAAQAFDQSERQFQRLSKLRESGLVSVQSVEDAEIARNNAQSDLEAARSREVAARQQLQRTEARAPFDGIVSDRKVSAGDTAQIGKELLKVIDPSSMRFEGLVSADGIGRVKPGQAVIFRVHGYAEQQFIGKVTRVNPAANATTRQVEVLVDFMDAAQQPKLAGLYAEGRIETTTQASLMLPASAVVHDGDRAFAWRVRAGKLEKTPLDLGERDVRSGDLALNGGLDEGDRVLRYPTSTLQDGQKVELAVASAPDSDAVAARPAKTASSAGVPGARE